MALSRSPVDDRTRLDFWQAASGAVLALFVCVHLVLEGTVVLSPALTNGIAWLLEVTMLAQVAAPVIMLLILFHFYIAARKMPFRANELGVFVQHSKGLKEVDTWLWLVQVFTAIVILAGAFYHIYSVMTDLPINVAGSACTRAGWPSTCSFCLASFCIRALACTAWPSSSACASRPRARRGASGPGLSWAVIFCSARWL